MARIKIGNVYPSDEYLLERCAPAGYGLGATIARLPDYTLLDITTSGFYGIDGSVGEKIPVDEDQFWYSNVLKMGAFQFLHGTNTNSMVIRNNHTGTEEWVNPPMMPGVEYRTTERYMGKTVYTKLVDCGSMPNASSMVVAHGIAAIAMIRCCGTTDIGTTIPYRWNDNYLTVSADRTNIHICTNTDFSNQTCIVQLWYTKD